MEFFFAIIMFILAFIISRWVFRVNEIVDLQKRQIYILTMMAKKSGVPPEALSNALGDAVDPLWKKYAVGSADKKESKDQE